MKNHGGLKLAPP